MNPLSMQPHFLIVLLLLSASTSFAETLPWAPPAPDSGEKDWIKLTSGEWLWGTIDLMRDEELSFDSDNLDDLTIDWEDIQEIRSARIMTYVLNDGTSFSGTSFMKEGMVQIETSTGTKKITSDMVSAILDGESTERNFWSAKMGSDLKLFRGNTNQSDFGNWVMIKRQAIRSRLDLKYQGNTSKVNGAETANNHRGNADWKIFVSRRIFFSPVIVELFSDNFKNVNLRSDIGSGFGYYLRRDSKMDLYVETGASWSRTNYSSVVPGEEGKDSSVVMPLRTTLETSLTKRVDLTMEYKIQLGLSSDATTLHHAYVLLEFDLFRDIDFDFSVVWDHSSNPKADQDGITPKKDDMVITYGLSIEF